MQIVIVIPTYQEATNISSLISKIKLEEKKIKKQLVILVVDDNSPDGTGEVIKKLTQQYSDLYLLSGEKKGLGNAYTRGFKFAIEKLKADVIIQMDADFSHDPDDLSRLVNEINKGYDVVVGSRYIKGGKITNLSPWRRFLSKQGNSVCRSILNIKTVADCTAGFRAIKTQALNKINYSNFKTNGYSFQLKLIYQLIKANAKIKEIPVKFIDRRRGATKLGVWDIMEGIITLFKLRFSR